MVNPQLNNGLPAFLSPQPGLQSGAMIMQYAAASLVSENKHSRIQQVWILYRLLLIKKIMFHGTIASRHGYQMIENARRLAIETIIALQAVEYKDIDKLSPKTYEKYQELRHIVPSITEDRQFHKDIEAVYNIYAMLLMDEI